VRQPRKRWVSHRRVAGCAAIAAVVTSGVSHRLCRVAKSRDWHETCGSCWSRATAAKALGQSQLGRRMYRFAAVVTSGVSHRCCSVTTSRDWLENCGSCWSRATAEKALGQAHFSGRMYRFAAVVTSGVFHRFGSVTKSRDWLENCGSCWSCATAAKALGQSPSSGRVCRYLSRRDLRRLPQILQRGEISRLARDLWELLELCDSRESGGSGTVEWPDVPLSLPS
jgi:hypothetical protein